MSSVTITAQTGGSTYKYYLAVSDPLVWYQADTAGTTLADASGHGKTATITGTQNTNYNFTGGMEGTALHLITGGTPAVEYASLPSGIVSGLNDFTVSTWVKIDTLNTWARVFDFGTGTTVNMYLTPRANGTGGPLRFAITTSGSGNEQRLDGPVLSAGAWYHVAITLSGNTGTLYVNGAVAATNTGMSIHPASLGTTTQNYLGKSQYSDPGFQGSIDDFRIYSRALSASEVLALAKPTLVNAAAPGASPVTTTATTLSVLGTDQTAGESALTYTWATTGSPPAPVTFSVNGANAAKNTTANFTSPGTYNFQVTILNPATGSTLVTTTSATVTATLTSITVSPATVSLNDSGTQQFTATAKDQFGTALSSQPTFAWSASGGSIDSSGLFTAPFASGNFQVTATSGATIGSATANITILAGDVDGDGQRTAADVGTFVSALADIPTYDVSHDLTPSDALAACNLDGDGAVTNLDLQAMIVMLANAAAGGAPQTSASSAATSFSAAARAGADSSQMVSSALVVDSPLRDSSPILQLPPDSGAMPLPGTVKTSAGLSDGSESDISRKSVKLSPAQQTSAAGTASQRLIDGDTSSVPRLTMRNRLANILALDEIFNDWPSMAVSWRH